MKKAGLYSKITKPLLNFLFPGVCFGCNAVLSGEEQTLCFRCAHDLPFTENSFVKQPEFERFFTTNPLVESGWACLVFRAGNTAGELIRHLKFRDHYWISGWLGKRFKSVVNSKEIELVIPIPIHPKRRRKRGYNQVEGFALELANQLQAEYLPSALKVAYYRSAQARKSREKRLENRRNYFQLGQEVELMQKTVLVVDDVLTTGATLDSAFDCLTRAQVKKIYWITMVWTPLP